MKTANTIFHMLCFSKNPLPWYLKALKMVLFVCLWSIEEACFLYRWIKRKMRI